MIIVNGEKYLDRCNAFKKLHIDRKKWANGVKKALKDCGKAAIPGFKFELITRGKANGKKAKATPTKAASKTKSAAVEKTAKPEEAAAHNKDAGLAELCSVCERVAFGDVVRLAHGHWRHAACAPGSQTWCEYYERLSPSRHTQAGDLIYANAKKPSA